MKRYFLQISIIMIPLLSMGRSLDQDRMETKMAYTLYGEGDKLLIAIPGIGDTQNQYRFLVPELLDIGYQVATIDLRGHGSSPVEWADYSAAANGRDIVNLIDELGAKHVVLVGNSIGGATSVWVAAERPDIVKAIVMINPFVQDPDMKWYERVLFKAALARPWGKQSWLKFYSLNYPSQKPEDHKEHLQEIDDMLSRPGGYRAFSSTLWSSHAEAATRIPEVRAPVQLIMGSKDPDFKDPQAEMEKLKGIFNADTEMVAGAGHYPHLEFPTETNAIILKYLKGLTDVSATKSE